MSILSPDKPSNPLRKNLKSEIQASRNGIVDGETESYMKFPHLKNRIKPKVSHAKPKKKLNNRRKFKAHGANPLKTYPRKLTDYQVLSNAEMQRQNRLRNRTPAETRFEAILNEIGIKYEKEKIIQNGDRFVLADFFLGGAATVIEIDGDIHKQQAKYDAGRDRFIETLGYRTIRFTNQEVLKDTQVIIEKLNQIINQKEGD